MEQSFGFKAAAKMFPDFDVIDADDTYFSVRKDSIGRIGARIDAIGVSSLQVEKFGERTKLFRGANLEAKARAYLGL
jgi:hypothetical protein